MHRIVQTLMATVCLLVIAGSVGCALQSNRAEVQEIAPGILAGYLPKGSLPNSLALLPPPPAKDSTAFALDEEVSRKALALRGTPRWTLATEDAELMFPQAAGAFACALGAPISENGTPHLYLLLRRTLADAGLSTYAAKDHYQRTRPCLVNKQPTCTPDEEKHAAKDFSYPSGHSALGWAWALVLAEIAPERADTILARGVAFSESRVVCNVHWQSDVVAGRFMGTATVARLHADPGFRKDLDTAKAEYVAVRAKGLDIGRDCKAEADALKYGEQPPY
jgi:acid phosphatase (class A)